MRASSRLRKGLLVALVGAIVFWSDVLPANASVSVVAVVVCSDDSGQTAEFQVGWDTGTQFFENKGNIAALFCSIASNGFPNLVSAVHIDGSALSDAELFFDGVPTATSVVTASPTADPTITPTPVESPSTEPVVTPDPVPEVVPVVHDYLVSEGGVLSAVAPAGMLFQSVSAWYGSPTDNSCGVDVSQIVGARFLGLDSGSIEATNNNFGDPCPGVVKVLWADFSYATVPVEPTPSESPSPETVPPVIIPPVIEPPVVVPPVSSPSPTVDPTPEATITPTVDPTPEATVDPTPEPTIQPTVEPIPTAVPKPVATVAPQPEPTATAITTPIPEPSKDPKPVEPVLTADSSPAEIAAVVAAANAVLDSAPQGSPAYEAALAQLAEAAAADDPQVPTEIANIPGVGPAAVAVLNAFNTLGNLGADISPKVRKQMKKVGTAVIVMGITASAPLSIRRK